MIYFCCYTYTIAWNLPVKNQYKHMCLYFLSPNLLYKPCPTSALSIKALGSFRTTVTGALDLTKAILAVSTEHTVVGAGTVGGHPLISNLTCMHRYMVSSRTLRFELN